MQKMFDIYNTTPLTLTHGDFAITRKGKYYENSSTKICRILH